MQRRAAAVYVALFLLIGAASYALVATAQKPAVTFPNEEPLGEGSTLTVDGRTYEVSSIEASVSQAGGGHGGGGGGTLTRSGALSWTNESARYTETWDNGSTVTHDGEQWVLEVAGGDGDPTRFVLREAIDRAAILRNDTAADNETVTRDGTEYVVLDEDGDGNATLVPADSYFPEPETRSFAEGDTIRRSGNETTVASVTNESVTLAWTAPRTNTVQLSDGSRVTLNGREYLAVFPSNSSVILTRNFERYEAEQHDIEQYHTHVNGLWGVSIVSGVTAVVLVMLAYVPSRY